METDTKKTEAGNNYDEITKRTIFAFNKAITVGQKILTATFDKLKEIKEDQNLNLSDKQGRLISKEVTKILLFWLTREVWTYVVENENDAKKANLLLFSWFKEKYGIEYNDIEEYAKSAGTAEEVKIFGKNVANISECYGAIEIFELNTVPVAFFEEFTKNMKESFDLPIFLLDDNQIADDKSMINKINNGKEGVRTLVKPLLKWFFVLLIPIVVAVYFFVDHRLGLAIFLGILFSAFSSVLLVATLLYTKGTAMPIREKTEDPER